MNLRRTLETTKKRGYYCGACKAKLANFGSMGNHVRYNPECTFEKRFWGRVEMRADGCWIYDGATDKWGYKHIAIRTKRIQAHRWSWEQANGPIPAGKLIMHSCDVPACVNPAHMRLGTDYENQADMRRKGREARGEQLRAKLKEHQVRDIRKRFRWYSQRKTNAKELAAEYGVTTGTILHAASGNTWSYLK